MNNKLVDISIRILRSLPSEGMHVNAIFRQTGLSYKPDVIEAIRLLEKGVLIETKRSTYKQKKIKRPTTLGLEFKRFMTRIEEFNEAFDRFEISRKQNFDDDIMEKNPRILRSGGWTELEVDLRKETFLATHLMRDFLERNIFNALLCRYAILVAGIGDNDHAKHILTKMVTDEILRQLLIIQRYYTPQTELMETLPGTLAFGIVTDIAKFYRDSRLFLHNHHINKEVRNVIMSLLSIPEQFMKKLLKDQIPSMKVSTRLIEVKSLVKEPSKKRLIKNRGNWELFQIFRRLEQLP